MTIRNFGRYQFFSFLLVLNKKREKISRRFMYPCYCVFLPSSTQCHGSKASSLTQVSALIKPATHFLTQLEIYL